MKKKLLIACMIPFICAAFKCVNSNSKVSNLASPANTIPITLNGIDSSAFEKERLFFVKNKDSDLTPAQTSIWFSKDEIHRIVSLLNDEINQQQKNGRTDGLIDGIRIYFIADTNGGTKHLKNRIALVSTFYNGSHTGTDGKEYEWHRDYFRHATTAALAGHEGQFCYDNCGGGAVLYTDDPNAQDDTNCDYTQPHALRRKDANMLVMNFGKKPINTYSVWFETSFWVALDNDSQHNGIRIYFARHTDNDANPLFKDRDTFVITTTKQGGNANVNTDYFGCDPVISEHKVSRDTSAGQDKGELCPYNCNL